MRRVVLAVVVVAIALALLCRRRVAPEVIQAPAVPSNPAAAASSRPAPAAAPSSAPGTPSARRVPAPPPNAPTHQTREACEATCDTACTGALTDAWRCPARCTSDDTCTEDELCMITTRRRDGGRVRRCLGSECSGQGVDQGCGPDRRCEPRGNPSGAIFRCVDTGRRGFGEACQNEASSPEETCAGQLLCTPGGCLPPCTSDRDCAGAPALLCGKIDGPEEAGLCFPHCGKDGDCPAGHRCAELPHGHALCVRPENAGCSLAGCPAGETCLVVSSRLGDIRSQCVRHCRWNDPASCGTGEVCATMVPLEPPVCMASCARDGDCTGRATCTRVDASGGEARACALLPEGIRDLRAFLRRGVMAEY